MKIGKHCGQSMALLRSLALGTSLLACSQVPETSNTKVYGGHAVKGGEWLNTVGIGYDNGLFCSGVVVTPTLVVTAAHCLQGTHAPSLRVYVGQGEEGGAVVGDNLVAARSYNPDFSMFRFGHDIGFLKLQAPLDLPAATFVPLATPAEVASDGLDQAGQAATIVGFGEREAGEFGVKFEVDIPVIAYVDGIEDEVRDPANEILAGGRGKDACQGDSGGPLFTRLKDGSWRVLGVVSRGGDCGIGGVYSSVAANLCWLQQESREDLGLSENDCPALPPVVVSPVAPVTAPAPNDWWIAGGKR